ncbi:MAG: GntR family transcriptional regulator [Pseudomonadota bacterium]
MARSASQDIPQGETAYQALYEAVRDGRFRPGDRLREVEVAETLGFSRTPVREAMRRLEADGIVEHKPRIGAVVRTLTHPEVVELYEMRIVLERTAAEMSARHASGAQIDTLAELNEQIATCEADGDRAAAINQQFHRTLYNATRNRFLLSSARGLNNALMLLGRTTLEGENRISTVVEQHGMIIEALRKRDETAAGMAAEEHLQTSLRHRLKGMPT